MKLHNTHPKLTSFDPSDLHEAHLQGKPANLIFHADSSKDCMTHSIVPTSTEPHYSKALPSKINDKKTIPIFCF
jgi:hypothetical protein